MCVWEGAVYAALNSSEGKWDKNLRICLIERRKFFVFLNLLGLERLEGHNMPMELLSLQKQHYLNGQGRCIHTYTSFCRSGGISFEVIGASHMVWISTCALYHRWFEDTKGMFILPLWTVWEWHDSLNWLM